MLEKFKEIYVKLIYADHNRSRSVRSALNSLIDAQEVDAIILNIGSGKNRIRENIKNLDIFPGENVDYVGSAEQIPLSDNSVDLIVTQEAFEHIQDPNKAIRECYRILRPGGGIYFQVPFIIGYHPGPTDFLRFTREGVIEFLEQGGFDVERIDITVGGATGFYRVSVEFFAILFSGPVNKMYMPLKALFSLLLYPIKFLDPWFATSSQKDRIPGGYLAIAYKK